MAKEIPIIELLEFIVKFTILDKNKIFEIKLPDPFIISIELLSSNINGGLGIWAGYGVSYYYIPIVSDTVIYDTYNQVNVFDIF
mgnify:CR=1 FL=1